MKAQKGNLPEGIFCTNIYDRKQKFTKWRGLKKKQLNLTKKFGRFWTLKGIIKRELQVCTAS